MSDVDRVLGWFHEGTLLRPDPDRPNLLDLSDALGALSGASLSSELNTNARHLARTIGEPEHVVFVLVDGLGTNLLERLPRGSLFRTSLAMELGSVFPSSTAPCLTSLATGLWPAEHGVPGWFAYLAKHEMSIMVLPFTDRSLTDARTLGVTGDEVFVARARTAEYQRATHWVMPKPLVGTVYTTYTAGGALQTGYEGLVQGASQIVNFIELATRATYTYWYISHVDYVEHMRGASHPDVAATVMRVEASVATLAAELAGRATIVVTADHGQIDIPDAERHAIPPDDPMMQNLVAPPACEPRVPAFHVRPGSHEAFVAEFRRRFGATWALLTIDEVDDMRLFGPRPLSVLTRARLGDYVGLNPAHEVLLVPGKNPPLLGSHGGLLPDEVLVPLIIV